MSGIVRYNRTRTSGLVKTVSGVPAVAGDKSPASSGDMWYNSSANTLRCYIPVAAFAQGGTQGTARSNAYGCGTASALFVVGGSTPPYTNTCESYNGTAWSAEGNLPAAIQQMGNAGTPTDSIATGGYKVASYLDESYTYNGTGWSAGSDMPDSKASGGNMGRSSTEFGFFGSTQSEASPSATKTDSTFIWNGTAWSTGGTLSAGVSKPGGAGTTTAGLKVGGTVSSFTTTVEEYNGTDWTTVTAYPVATEAITGGGLQTNAFFVGGILGALNPTDDVNFYNGTSWSASTDYPIEGDSIGTSSNSTTSGWTGGGGLKQRVGTGAATYDGLTYEWSEAAANATVSTE